MNHLRKDRGEIFDDLLPEGFWQALPEAFRPYAHVAEGVSLIKEISSSIASRVSLLTVLMHGWGAKFVADTGTLNSTRCPYTTRI
jgi:hypothetical protein